MIRSIAFLLLCIVSALAGAGQTDAARHVPTNAEIRQQYAADLAKNAQDMARAEALYAREEKLIARHERDTARYEKILGVWERQQAQYQKYLDSLDKK